VKRDGLVKLYPLFAKDMVYPERATISERRGINRRG
jgi:hypothetical protein